MPLTSLAELRPKYEAQTVEKMTTLTEQWCAGLVDHLRPRMAAFLEEQQKEQPPSLRHAPGMIEAIALDYAKNKALLCKDDVFYKKNLGYWKCQWKSSIKDADKCRDE